MATRQNKSIVVDPEADSFVCFFLTQPVVIMGSAPTRGDQGELFMSLTFLLAHTDLAGGMHSCDYSSAPELSELGTSKSKTYGLGTLH